ncbi:MAG TPA: DUF4403 family protein [Longimicrobium sp.]|nr:DUF4403 family protein [Longimicrobium sp.]
MNPSRFRPLLAAPLLALLAGVAGCRDSMRIPAPDERGEQRPVPEPQASTVTLPITVSLASVAAQVEKKVPHGQNHEDEWHPLGSFPVVGTLYVKEMWERDPLSLKLDGDHLDLSAHVRYRARVAARACVLGSCRWVPLAGCGQDGPMPSMDVGLRTDIGLRPNWTVAAHTTPRRVRPGFRCRLTGANIDVTERVQNLVQDLLDKHAPEIDQRIREAANLHYHVESVWRTVQEPIKASKGVYVLMQPEALSATPPVGSGTTLTTTVSVVVRPKMVIGERPAVTPEPLPPNGRAAPGNGFRIQMVAELPFTVMDSIVRKKLVGRSFDIEGHRIRVRGARLYGAGTKLVLAATVSGDARGTLYFVGTPVFDPDSQVVSVPDLDFSVESRSVLPEVAEWLLYDQLRDQMRESAHFAVGDRIYAIRRDVDAALDRQLARGVRSTGRVDRITPLGVFVFSKSVAAVVQAEGQAQIHIDIGAPRRPPRDSSTSSRSR